jgi:hypothetical protein
LSNRSTPQNLSYDREERSLSTFQFRGDIVEIFIVSIAVAFCLLCLSSHNHKKRLAQMSPRELSEFNQMQAETLATFLHGTINPVMFCPHCQTKGSIRSKMVSQKKGVSGGKATAALLTGGVSMLLTGLSRKESGTQALCGNCNSSWVF